MIWITGDIHGDPTRFSTDCFPEQKEMTKDDVVIILGDFGLVWNAMGESKTEKYWLKWLEEKPFTTVFIDGNHENFDRLYKYPIKEWNGGKVHEIRPHILHLIRGEIFEIEGLKFFAFGGASSHDIQDGVLDPEEFDSWDDFKDTANQWDKELKMFRVKGFSWWQQELPTKEEMENGIENLKKNNYRVNYILTHSPSASVVALLGQGMYKQDCLTKYLEEIRTKTDYKIHFCGHMHINKMMNNNDILLYEQIIRIA